VWPILVGQWTSTLAPESLGASPRTKRPSSYSDDNVDDDLPPDDSFGPHEVVTVGRQHTKSTPSYNPPQLVPNDTSVTVSVQKQIRRKQNRGKTLNQRRLAMSDPQNPGVRFCWKFVFPLLTPYNWGHLVPYRECIEHPNSFFYQETTDSDVCVADGGVEMLYTPFDDSSLPYKVACIPRLTALNADSETCWKMEGRYPMLTLTRLDDESARHVCGNAMPWPFHDGQHISSRFDHNTGGVDTLYSCNGGDYKKAHVLYRMDSSGRITGFGRALCEGVPKQYSWQCKGAVSSCLHYLPPEDTIW